MMTGEWSKTYPVWIEDWGISRDEYSGIIDTLEQATKPLAQSMWTAQQNAVKNMHMNITITSSGTNTNQALNTMMGGMLKMQKIQSRTLGFTVFRSNVFHYNRPSI